ncbi:hypothetical protein NP233_g6045 [Leucocoprinus birnbaumii]|uniref:tRNA-dihydrouridine(47) synthase [NAD(P)(+)] n=1 Tax=Leucocoprinus birnbaumii TaxID=56174 RepID=A0AAD5VUG0_9AGAR|nr:hypothetical protein NP233_g6045 [Leucocoprinus birnbaumii]
MLRKVCPMTTQQRDRRAIHVERLTIEMATNEVLALKGKHMSKEEKKATRGANKGRRFGKTRDDVDLCWKIANGSDCEYGDKCRFSHDISAYLGAKKHDLRIPESSEIIDTAPFIEIDRPVIKPHPSHPSLDLATTCPVFAETGECRYGFKCRFLGAHVRVDGENVVVIGDEDKKARSALTANELNFASNDVLNSLRTKKYPLPLSTAYLNDLKGTEEKADKPSPVSNPDTMVVAEPEQDLDAVMSAPENTEAAPSKVDELISKQTGTFHGADGDVDVPMRYREKKRLHWTGKTYLAPLTTVGNLPFRRLCVTLGADITCGEMGLANSFLAGSKEEWSLVRRHPSEKIFGVQVAGNKPANLVPTAEVIAKELAGGVDFVDVNCGCPIDLVFKQGSGSALIDAPGKLGRIVVGMSKVLGDIPVTVKMRTGVKDGKNTAHKLMPRVADWGASCLTLHGRTRQQRYTRLADWDYIRQCVEAVRAQEEEEDLPPIPIFGGGDCFSSQDYFEKLERGKVDGVMIGRGALIKPWIFTEIKERREWDISARERLDLIRDYVNYGLNHFGSDTAGVNTTRRYLCEALSFQYRYVPIGLLENLPGRINDRAPAFRGRSDLGKWMYNFIRYQRERLTLYMEETLLSSGDSKDWIKISEMFLGPAPDSWVFVPKHKTPHIPPETTEETEQVNFLLEMMGDFVSRTEALGVFRKHKGNVERAADAIINGDRGEDYNWDGSQSTAPPGYLQSTQQIGLQPLKPSNSGVIDLTGSDDELNRAMAMSLETETTFGPSNRPPDSNWAMVPTDQSGDNPVLSNEEKSYNDAIQASLEDFASTNESDFMPINNVREGGRFAVNPPHREPTDFLRSVLPRPVALRSDNPSLAYAALLIQALFSVPQVRERVSSIRLPNIRDDIPRESPGKCDPFSNTTPNNSFTERAAWNLVEVFVNMDLAQLATIIDTEVLPSLMAQPLLDHNAVGASTAEFAKVVADVIEGNLRAQGVDDEEARLMYFTHAQVEIHRRMPPGRRYYSNSHSVLVEYGNDKIPYTDLISCLSGTLSSWADNGESTHDVIVNPSDVFCFRLQRLVNESGKHSPEPFTFPKSIYLDQFLLGNLELANKTRMAERRLLDEIAELTMMKEGLTRHNNRDVLKDLEGTLYYYENVADAGDDFERAESLKRTKTKLQNVVASISRKVEAIDYKIEKLQTEVAGIYDIPELQQHQYDLRAILIHTGLPGRKQIYSYVQDIHGGMVEDCRLYRDREETVFSDPTGLHLGAGPYMLIYSRHVEKENLVTPQWPRMFIESVEQHNQTLLSYLPPEVVAKTQAVITVQEATPPPPSSSPEPSQMRRLKSE